MENTENQHNLPMSIEPTDEPPNYKEHWCGGYNALDAFDNFPFFNKMTPLDFPFITPATTSSADTSETPSENTDCIDVKALVIPDCFSSSSQATSSTPGAQNDAGALTQPRKRNSKLSRFLSAKDRPPLRRNPKRQAKMRKSGSTDENENIYTPISYKETNKEPTTRRKRAPPSTHSTPQLNTVKQWPANGMHEKPHFNPVTKKLEMFPSSSSKVTTTKRLRNRKKLTQIENKHSDGYEEQSFATVAHHNLHYVLSYVKTVKEYYSRGRVDVNGSQEKAIDLLRNACILYCVANNVEESALVDYLNDLASKDDITDFLNDAVQDDKVCGV